MKNMPAELNSVLSDLSVLYFGANSFVMDQYQTILRLESNLQTTSRFMD